MFVLNFYTALDIAFGSLYREDIMITPVMVVSVLAAATHLGLVSTPTDVKKYLRFCGLSAI